MVKNIAASVRDRLLNLARSTDDDFNQLLDRYTRERFLYRLSQSEIGNKYILKGASVFQVWGGSPHRPTRDIDLLGFGSNNPQTVKQIFEEICQQEYQDGIEFANINTEVLQATQKYEGVRLNIEGKLGTAKLFLQVDLGFGHVVTPPAEIYEIPSLLDMPSPSLRVYPPETVVAEKLEAMVSRGLKNSRIKDYYDLLFLSKKRSFDGKLLTEAIRATFNQRQTEMPAEVIPVGLTLEFIAFRPSRDIQWKKLFQQGTMDSQLNLSEAIASIREFLLPPLQAAATGSEFNQKWTKDGGWQKE